MARQYQFKSSAQRGTLYCSYKRFLRPFHGIEKLMRDVHELFHSAEGPVPLSLVHLLQISPGTEIPSFHAYKDHAGDGGRSFGCLHDVLPLEHALDIQYIDGLSAVIESSQQDAIVKNCGLKVSEIV